MVTLNKSNHENTKHFKAESILELLYSSGLRISELINLEFKNIDSYKCLDCDFEYKKQYFFISHSHLDIEKVRIIRNIIEETFFYEPILFFLKCLSDDNEIQNLIEREISERIWFVYCDSENARNSMYVNKERQYVKKLVENGKKINILNIELDKFNIWDKQCYEYIKDQISFHIRKSKIFFVCSTIWQHKSSGR